MFVSDEIVRRILPYATLKVIWKMRRLSKRMYSICNPIFFNEFKERFYRRMEKVFIPRNFLDNFDGERTYTGSMISLTLHEGNEFMYKYAQMEVVINLHTQMPDHWVLQEQPPGRYQDTSRVRCCRVKQQRCPGNTDPDDTDKTTLAYLTVLQSNDPVLPRTSEAFDGKTLKMFQMPVWYTYYI